MYLMFAIIASSFLGVVLMTMGPTVGLVIAFGIIFGFLMRILYLLEDMHKRISRVTPKPDKVREAVEDYLKEKSERENTLEIV